MANTKKKAEKVAEEAKVEQIEKTIEEKLDNTIKNTDFTETKETINKIEEEIAEKIEKSLEPTKEIITEAAALSPDIEKINGMVLNSPEEAEKYIKAELKKANDLKEKINTHKKNNYSFTNSWNGMNYDI